MFVPMQESAGLARWPKEGKFTHGASVPSQEGMFMLATFNCCGSVVDLTQPLGVMESTWSCASNFTGAALNSPNGTAVA